MEALALGQAGFLFSTDRSRLLIDPYLSDSVAVRYGAQLTRQVPVIVEPGGLAPVDALLLTHIHLDHTDPDSLVPLAAASPGMKVFAPYECRTLLADLGLAWEAFAPPLEWTSIAEDLEIRAVPAAHTDLERNGEEELRFVGFLIRNGEVTIYHAGDTIPHPEIFTALAGEKIDYALLPINERNFFRDRDDIVGNMTVRETFAMASGIGAKTLIPIHWDMFAPNRVHPEEIELLYQLEAPPFSLEIMPAGAMKLLASR